MACMCGDSQCPSCGLAQGTLEPPTEEFDSITDYLKSRGWTAGTDGEWYWEGKPKYGLDIMTAFGRQLRDDELSGMFLGFFELVARGQAK